MKPRLPDPRLIVSTVLPVIVLFLSAAYTGWWFYLTVATRNAIEGWAEQRRAEGWTISHSPIEVGGYPRAVTLSMKEPLVAAPAGYGWQAAGLVVEVRPLRPNRVLFTAQGRHDLRLPGSAGSPSQKASLTAGRAEGHVTLSFGGQLDGAGIDLENANLKLPDGRPLAAHRLTAACEPVEPETGSPAKPGMAFSVEAEALDLPPAPGLVLGRKVASVVVKGEVKGQIPKGSLPAALDHWREQGGTVEVERLGVHWEPLHLTAGGSLALDQELQPIAAFSANVQGFFETVDAFRNAGLVRARDASMAKVVLGMMAKTPPGGGAPMLTVPLTVQNGILSAGPAVLGPVPRLAWPG